MFVTIFKMMTSTFEKPMKSLTTTAIFLGLSCQTILAADEDCTNPNFIFKGLTRTDEAWLRDYLELAELSGWNEKSSGKLRQKILTTDIFTAVTIERRRESSACDVDIHVSEKWTTIPVIRGAYGGGTPLAILGGYETNAFGRLMALGGELRRYGTMAPGAFFFFKSPRAWRGRGLWGGELWLDRRRRDFFDADAKIYGYVKSESWLGKMQLLYPIGTDQESGWQAGFQAQLSREEPARFLKQPDYDGQARALPSNIKTSDEAGFGVVAAPMVAYDNLAVDGLNYDGVKSKFAIGAAKNNAGSGRFAETELYIFSHLPGDINLAGRVFAASTSETTAGSIYYLGGFDSVRGLPDGIHYGNNIAFGNFEARIISAKFTYAHVQSAVFLDTGSAWMRGDDFTSGRETSLGAGVRISIPQVYRFVVRLDYGLSIGATKSRGFSIGLNQFFQPYKLVF